MNLIHILQTQLSYEPLEKVSPNTQDIHKEGKTSRFLLAQAALTFMLTVVYRFTRKTEQATALSNGEITYKNIFGNDYEAAVASIANYAGVSKAEVEAELQKIWEKTAALMHGKGGKEITAYLSGQRDIILSYLPQPLQAGAFLKDDTLDDNTNKMGGPASGFLHKVENLFSDSEKNDASKT
jgi:hypothetical protein